MPTPIVIRKKLESASADFPELMPFIGKEIEIVVRECPVSPERRFAILDEVAQMDLLDFDAIKRQDELEWAHVRGERL